VDHATPACKISTLCEGKSGWEVLAERSFDEGKSGEEKNQLVMALVRCWRAANRRKWQTAATVKARQKKA